MQGAIGLLLLLLLAALLLLHALALLVLVDLPTHRRALHALLHVMHRAALAILTLRIRCGLLLLHRRRLLLLRSSDAEQCQERHAGGEAGGRFHCCGGSSELGQLRWTRDARTTVYTMLLYRYNIRCGVGGQAKNMVLPTMCQQMARRWTRGTSNEASERYGAAAPHAYLT